MKAIECVGCSAPTVFPAYPVGRGVPYCNLCAAQMGPRYRTKEQERAVYRRNHRRYHQGHARVDQAGVTAS